MKYVQGTIVLPLIMWIDKYVNIKWYVDAEFAVNKDTMIHNGGFMNMGTGGDYLQSIKKKLTLRVQLRPLLSEWTMSWTKWYGPGTSWNNRDTRSMIMLYIKITIAP